MLVRGSAMEYNDRVLGQCIQGPGSHLRETEMKKALRFACLAVLALTVAGCGRKPQVPENTVAAAYVDLEKAYENGKLLARSVINEFPEAFRPGKMKAYEDALKLIDEYRNSLNPKWGVVAFGGTIVDLARAPRENIAMAIRVDTDEDTADTMLKKWMAQRAGREDIEPERHENGTVYEAYSFYAGRIEDDILILANSKDAFMAMFDLYTGKGKPSKDFGKLSDITGNTLARISTVPIHSLIDRFALTEEVEKFGKVGDDEDLADMILHLGPVTLDVLADGDDIGLSLRVVCGSSDDAKILEQLFHSIAFISRAGFDIGAYLAENPDRIPKFLSSHRDKISQSRGFFNAAARAFNAAREGRVAEITFANSMEIIAKSIAKIIIPGKPAEKDSPETPLR